jgi:hypothetical protein
MGDVIRLRDWTKEPPSARPAEPPVRPATVIILPVVRIERGTDDPWTAEPGTGNNSGRRRRRRATR